MAVFVILSHGSRALQHCVLMAMRWMFWLGLWGCSSLAWADWASETLEKLTIDEKIGQLFIVGVYPNQENAEQEGRYDETIAFEDALIRDLHVGGVLLKYCWTSQTQIKRVQTLQAFSHRIPLLVAQDLECGLGARLKGEVIFPKNMTLGAIQDDALLREMGRVMGRQARAVGVNFVLAPVVDVNTNPKNPVIHMRSFGEDAERVARKGEAVCQGLQEAGVLACAKHFPGHGETSRDSHLELPLLALDRQRLEEVEFLPFRRLIGAGVASVMTAHLAVPALDASLAPASLSQTVVTGALRGALGFQGLIITDDLLMDAIQGRMGAGMACKLAFLAGNDLILSSTDVREGIFCLQQAVASGEIAIDELDRRVLRILRAKQSLKASPETAAIPAEGLQRILYRQSMTLMGQCPSKGSLGKHRLIQIGGQAQEPFWEELGAVPHVVVLDLLDQGQVPTVGQGVIAAFYPSDSRVRPGFLASAPGSDEELARFWRWSSLLSHACHSQQVPLTIVWFGSPYGLRGVADCDGCLVAYESTYGAQQAAAEVVLGKIQARGVLPITARF